MSAPPVSAAAAGGTSEPVPERWRPRRGLGATGKTGVRLKGCLMKGHLESSQFLFIFYFLPCFLSNSYLYRL